MEKSPEALQSVSAGEQKPQIKAAGGARRRGLAPTSSLEKAAASKRVAVQIKDSGEILNLKSQSKNANSCGANLFHQSCLLGELGGRLVKMTRPVTPLWLEMASRWRQSRQTATFDLFRYEKRFILRSSSQKGLKRRH